MEAMHMLTLVGFPFLAILFFGLFFKEIKSAILLTPWIAEKKKRVIRYTLSGMITWSLLVTAASISGYTGNFQIFPLNVMPLLLIPLITTIMLLFTADMKTVVTQLSLKVLTQLQVFRFFVEIVLWLLFIQNLLPEQMTFEGRNVDILAGITSLFAARLLVNNKRWMIGWNIFGLALLLNIVTIAILSMPTPFRVFNNEPANTIVTHFPYVILPTFLVPLAYILHFMSLKKLLIKS